MGGYQKAEICLNGHTATSDFECSRGFVSPHCSECGVETIRERPSGKSSIRGHYHVEGVLAGVMTRYPLTVTHAATPILGHNLHLIRQGDLSRNWTSEDRDEKNKLNGPSESWFGTLLVFGLVTRS